MGDDIKFQVWFFELLLEGFDCRKKPLSIGDVVETPIIRKNI